MCKQQPEVQRRPSDEESAYKLCSRALDATAFAACPLVVLVWMGSFVKKALLPGGAAHHSHPLPAAGMPLQHAVTAMPVCLPPLHTRHDCVARLPPPLSFPSPCPLQKAAQGIKEALDKKFGPSWHCMVCEGGGWDITFESHTMLHLYYGEKLGVLIFKC